MAGTVPADVPGAVPGGRFVNRGRGELAVSAAALLVLLALVALAAGAHPLHVGGSTQSAQPSMTFFDYAWTTLILVIGAGVIVIVWAIVANRSRFELDAAPRRWWMGLPIFFGVIAVLALAFVRAHHVGLRGNGGAPFRNPNAGILSRAARTPGHTAHFRWEELVALASLVALVWAIAIVRRRRSSRPLRLLASLHRNEVSAALDEAVDDLRTEPDVRRAVIAAYARTERALAGARIPRRPAEAPFEYLERALAELDASADSIRRLTVLFERAKFAAGELGPETRVEAIDALLAVRDELDTRARRPVHA